MVPRSAALPPLRSRTARLLIPLLAVGAAFGTLLTSVGCGGGDFRPEASGKDGEIVIVIDSTYWNGPVGDTLRSTLGAYVGTLPTPERLFELRAVELDTEADFERVKRLRNIVFVAPLSDSTNEARVIRSTLSPEAREAVLSGEVPTVGVPREDLWRRNQQVYFITAATPEGLIDAILDKADDMIYLFNRAERRRLQRDMFEKQRQFDLEDTLMARHGFAVSVQHDYQIAIDTTNFVWLRRILTDTWRSVFIAYIENGDPSLLDDPTWIYDTRDSLTQRYVQGNLGGWVEIDRRRPLTTENINFLGRYGFETRGLWHMVGYDEAGNVTPFGMGGPFVTYTFYDEQSGRIYMIDGMVFAPNFPKREFLRQTEVIAYTFRTRADVEQARRADREAD